jgi:hypothetical protein
VIGHLKHLPNPYIEPRVVQCRENPAQSDKDGEREDVKSTWQHSNRDPGREEMTIVSDDKLNRVNVDSVQVSAEWDDLPVMMLFHNHDEDERGRET